MGRDKMARKDDFRITFKSELIAGSPSAYLSDLPRDKSRDRAGVVRFGARGARSLREGGQHRALGPAKHGSYAPIVKLNQLVDSLRRQRQ